MVSFGVSLLMKKLRNKFCCFSKKSKIFCLFDRDPVIKYWTGKIMTNIIFFFVLILFFAFNSELSKVNCKKIKNIMEEEFENSSINKETKNEKNTISKTDNYFVRVSYCAS